MKRVRLVTFAWGESYVADLLDITLAAILAPGNLPALVGEFECDVVILGEKHRFEQIKAHPTYARLRSLCPVRLVEIDDLIVAPLYGLALTYACYRAFEDLGEGAKSTALLYFNSDWIVADGAYRSLIPHIRAGEQLIVSPTYCVVTERVMPRIRKRLAEGAGVLAIPKREMADWTLRYRHNTIRAKTVNRRLFHMDVIEQFYWRVDAKTLLGHQMPIAIVCMAPQRLVPVPETFWDYGTISELSPGVTPKVLADSDEFLIMELRGEETYSEGLRLGWPAIADIGRQLATFVTKDHLDFGRFQLCLHSGELPPNLDEARAKLRRVVEEAYAQIPAPKDHIKHGYWWPQQALFEMARRDFMKRAGRAGSWGFRASPLTPMVLAEMERLDAEFSALEEPERTQRVNAALSAISGSLGQLEGLFISDLNAMRKAFQARVTAWLQPPPQAAVRPDGEPGPAVTPAAGLLRRGMRWLRTRLNGPHWLHPERALAMPLLRELPASAGLRTLLVSAQPHSIAARILRSLRRPFDVTSTVSFRRSSSHWQKTWDLIVFELAHHEMAEFRPLLRAALGRVEDGGKVILFHPHRRGPMVLDRSAIVNVFPPSDRLRVRYSGSQWSDLAVRVYDRARQLSSRLGAIGSKLAPLAGLALAGPISLISNLQAEPESGDEAVRIPASCASMMVSLPIDAEVRAELDAW